VTARAYAQGDPPDWREQFLVSVVCEPSLEVEADITANFFCDRAGRRPNAADVRMPAYALRRAAQVLDALTLVSRAGE
jgi:hypothetical protein